MRTPDTISICRWTEKIPEATWLPRQRHQFSLSPLVSWIAWLLKITNCNQLPTLECLFKYRICCHLDCIRCDSLFCRSSKKRGKLNVFLSLKAMSCSPHVFTKKWRTNSKIGENLESLIYISWKHVMNSSQIKIKMVNFMSNNWTDYLWNPLSSIFKTDHWIASLWKRSWYLNTN